MISLMLASLMVMAPDIVAVPERQAPTPQDFCSAPPLLEEAGYLLFRNIQQPFSLNPNSAGMITATFPPQPAKGFATIECHARVTVGGRTRSMQYSIRLFPNDSGVIVMSSELSP